MTAKDIRHTIRANYLQPAFLICVGVLTITASAMAVAVKMAGIYLKKEPLPLKQPLSRLDSFNLTPYRVVTKKNIDNQDIIETMGTEEYIQWTLEDTSVPAESAARFCVLFITYYPLPDIVPHAPDECYIGGGFRKVSSEIITLKVIPELQRPGSSSAEKEIGASSLVFAETKPDILASETTFPVFYVFSTNGEYASGRDATRRILNKNMFAKFSYYSKVEWKFYNSKFGQIAYPNKQEARIASEKLLSVILPILEKEHWPSGLW